MHLYPHVSFYKARKHSSARQDITTKSRNFMTTVERKSYVLNCHRNALGLHRTLLKGSEPATLQYLAFEILNTLNERGLSRDRINTCLDLRLQREEVRAAA